MRITAGNLRGRVLHVPDSPGLRPTPSKVRQALFNMLGPVEGITMLDLFAGSGVMAIEAISRGAESVTSVEKERKLVQKMAEIARNFDISEQWQMRNGSVEQALAGMAGAAFDLIFADPPYRKGFSSALPAQLDAHNIGCDQLIIEESSSVDPAWPSGWQCDKSRRYGDSTLHFLSRSSSDQA